MKLRDIACVSCVVFVCFCTFTDHRNPGILESTNQHERIDPAHLEMMTSNFFKGFVLKRIGAEPSSIYHSRLVDLLPKNVVEQK